MRKTLVLIILFTLLSVGTIGYAAAALLPLRDQVLVQESTVYGDSSAAEGLQLHFLSESGGALHWDTEVKLGSKLETSTDYTFTLPPKKVDSRIEQTNWLSLSPSIWGIPEFEEYDAEAGEKVPEIYRELAEGLKPGETETQIIFAKDILDYYSLSCRLNILDQEITFYGTNSIEGSNPLRQEMAKLFFNEFRFPVPEYLQLRLEVTYNDSYYNYRYGFEALSDYAEYPLDVVETMADGGFWFTFKTSEDNNANLDVSHLPNGYGLWCIPVDENGIRPELNMVYPLTPGIRILDLTTSADGKKILLSTIENNQVLTTVIDAETAEMLQQIPLTQLPAANADWCFYAEDGCIVVALIDTVSREKNLILLAEDEAGNYQVLWNLELNDTNSPVVYFHQPAENSYRYSYDFWPVMAWNGEKLAFAMADYRLCTFQVAVYDENGLACHGQYDTSLNLNPCTPEAFDPITLTWN